MPARPHRLGAVLAALFVSGPPASAQEPLFLRIRPQDSTPRDVGAGPSVAAARAAREAVWERSAARARIAIASICTGCLRPPSAAVPIPARTLTAAGASANGPASTPAADTALVPASDPIPPTRGDP